MKRISLLILAIPLASLCQCQTKDNIYSLSKELIKKKNVSTSTITGYGELSVVGKYKNYIALSGRDSTETLHFFLYNEKDNTISKDVINVDQKRNKIVRAKRHDNLTLLIGYFNLNHKFENTSIANIPIDSYEYQDLWIQINDKEYKIDSLPYHFIDKYYECKFSQDARYLICNPFTSVSAGYDPKEDGFVILYDLKDINKGRVEKKVIKCESCLNTFVFADTLIFQKEIPIGKGFDGDYHNIYKAPLNNIIDTTLLAHNIELEQISSNQEYILGVKYLYGKYCPVVVNLKAQKFQYILGREYPLDRSFFSIHEEKFAFDFSEYIIYIETPTSLPFDALRNVSKFTSKEDKELFWKKYIHSPLR